MKLRAYEYVGAEGPRAGTRYCGPGLGLGLGGDSLACMAIAGTDGATASVFTSYLLSATQHSTAA
jgi:hypothetical protein